MHTYIHTYMHTYKHMWALTVSCMSASLSMSSLMAPTPAVRIPEWTDVSRYLLPAFLF